MAGDLGTLRLKLEADANNLNAGITTAKANISSLSTVMKTGGQETMQLMFGLQSLGLVLGGIGATALVGIGGAVKQFGTFEEAMKNVQSIMQGSQKDFETLSNYAMKLGKDTVFSSTDAAKALYYLASAGYTVAQQMAVADSVLQLATSSQFDLARSAEMVATTITSFGLEASDAGRVVDVFAKSTAMGQLTMEKLSYALPMAASKANELGWSLEELTAWLGLLSDSGLKGEMSGMRVRDMLNELLNPSAKASEAMKSIGIEVGRLPALLKDPQALLALFVDKAKSGLLDAAMSSKIFGDTSEGMMLAVASQLKAMDKGTDAWKKYVDGLNNASGAAKQMADIQQQALTKSFEQLKGSIENLQIKIGGSLAPTLIDVSKSFEKLVDWLSTMDKQTVKSLTELTLLGGGLASLGGVAALAGSQFISMLGILSQSSPAVVALATKIGVLGLAFGDLALVIWAVKQAHDAWTETLDASYMKKEGTKQILLDQVLALDKMEKAFAKVGGQGQALGATFGELSASLGDNGKLMRELNELLGTNFNENTKVSTAYIVLNSNIARNRDELTGVNSAALITATSTGKIADANTKASESVKILSTDLVSQIIALEGVSEEQEKQNKAVLKLAETYATFDEGLQMFLEAPAEYAKEEASILSNYWDLITLVNQAGLADLLKTALEGQHVTGKALNDFIESFLASSKSLATQSALELGEAMVLFGEVTKGEAERIQKDSNAFNESFAKDQEVLYATFFEGLSQYLETPKAYLDQEQKDLVAYYDTLGLINQAGIEDLAKTAMEGLSMTTGQQVEFLKNFLDSYKTNAIQTAEATSEAIMAFGEIDKLAGEAILKDSKDINKAKLVDLIQFQMDELNNYDLQIKLIEQKYKDMLALSRSYGLSTIQLEEWKNQQIRDMHINQQLSLVTIQDASLKKVLEFQANELNSYKAQKILILNEYNERLVYAQAFGEEESRIEEWKNRQILNLRIQHAQEYLDFVGKTSNDLADSYIGILNFMAGLDAEDYNRKKDQITLEYNQKYLLIKQEFTDKKEQAEELRALESWKKDEIIKLNMEQQLSQDEIEGKALVRFAKWVDAQIQLLTDLKNAYLDLSSIIGAIGNLIEYLTGKSTSNVAKLGELLTSAGGAADGTGSTLSDWGKKLMATSTTAGTTAETGWLSTLGSGAKAGGAALLGNLAPLSLLGLFGYGVYALATYNPNAAEEARIKEKGEMDRMRASQEAERARKQQQIDDYYTAQQAKSDAERQSYVAGLTSTSGRSYTSTPAPLVSPFTGATMLRNKIFDVNTGKQISGSPIEPYTPTIATQPITSISGGMDLSSTNSILSELSRYAGQIQSTLWDNLPSIKGNTSKDIVINFAGLMSELQESNDMLRKNIVNALDFSKMENYLSIIASNTSKSNNTGNSQSTWDNIADEVARSLERRGIWTA